MPNCLNHPEVLIPVAAGVLGLALGALVMRLVCGRRIAGLRKSLTATEADLLVERNGREVERRTAEERLAEKDRSCTRMLAERDRASAQVLAEKDAAVSGLLASKDREFKEMVKTLEERFANLASTTLESRSKDLSVANRQSLDAAIKPLADQMAKFQEATHTAQLDNHRFGESIHKDIETICGYAKSLSDFAVAIKAGNTVQGRQGEDILAEKLRQAGLEENVTFFMQTGTGRDRPDAQVCDAENRWLVIDSKVSMSAYVDYMNPKLDDETRKARLKDHVNSVRGRIGSLVTKKYPEVLGKEYPDRHYLPVAAMFVPYESALNAALEAEPSLWQQALDGNVVLVTPITLIGYLRLVRLAWQHKDVEKKYAEVIKDANELLTRMNNFVLSFQSVGTALNAAQAAYHEADKVLVDGPRRQTIGRSMTKLIAAGAKLNNQNPLAVLNDESNEDKED